MSGSFRKLVAGLRFAVFAFTFVGVGVIIGVVLGLQVLPAFFNRSQYASHADILGVKDAFESSHWGQGDHIGAVSDAFGGARKPDVYHAFHSESLNPIRDLEGREMAFRMYQDDSTALHIYTLEEQVHSALVVWENRSEWLCLDVERLKAFADVVAGEGDRSDD